MQNYTGIGYLWPCNLQSAETTAALAALESEKDEVDKKIANLLDAIENGLLNVVVKDRLQEATTRKNQLDNEMSSLTEKLNHMQMTVSDVKKIMCAYMEDINSKDPAFK